MFFSGQEKVCGWEIIDLPATLLTTLDASCLMMKTDMLHKLPHLWLKHYWSIFCAFFFFFFGCLPVWEWDPQEVNSWDISRSESMNWRKGKEMSAMSWHDNRNIILHILRLNAQRWFELCSQIIYDNRWRLQGGVYLKRMRIRWRVLVSRVFACNFLSVEQNKKIKQFLRLSLIQYQNTIWRILLLMNLMNTKVS